MEIELIALVWSSAGKLATRIIVETTYMGHTNTFVLSHCDSITGLCEVHYKVLFGLRNWN